MRLRPYGPGRYHLKLDAYVHQVALEVGGDLEIGSAAEADGHYTLMRDGSTVFLDEDPFCEGLCAEEAIFLHGLAGLIIREDNQGFVHVSYFRNPDDLEVEWAQVEDRVCSYEYDAAA